MGLFYFGIKRYFFGYIPTNIVVISGIVFLLLLGIEVVGLLICFTQDRYTTL